jgi:negative regulator of replication initiation
MHEDKKPLREALNLRIDEVLAEEIDRIAALRGESASEVARRLLGYGAEVERRLQAQKLMQHYGEEHSKKDVAGRVVIQAEFVPYTWQEVAEMREDVESRGEYSRLPTWEDIAP